MYKNYLQTQNEYNFNVLNLHYIGKTFDYNMYFILYFVVYFIGELLFK